ncbi:MAG: glycosyl transferase [Synechococcus sp.]
MSVVYVAISSHGFGHATRVAAAIDCLLQLNPEILPVIVTAVPRWLFDKHITSGKFLYRPRPLDFGVIQSDSLTIDRQTTLHKLEQLREQADEIVRAEADFIRLNRIKLVFGDIPPLACAIAKAAGVPCWMSGNFSWDFIYRDYGPEFCPHADWIAELYSMAERLFRLPFHHDMEAFSSIEDVGLTGSTPALPANQVRSQLKLDPQRPTVLVTFGGMGIQDIPYQNLSAFPDWQFVTLDTDAPDKLDNLRKLNGEEWRPVDLLPVCHQAIVKPGYGTFAEVLRLQVPVRCITRPNFAEAPLLVDGLRQFGWHHILKQEQVLGNSWSWLEEDFVPPSSNQNIDLNGNWDIARALAAELAQPKRQSLPGTAA